MTSIPAEMKAVPEFDEIEHQKAIVPLSVGASHALGSVLRRLLDSSKDANHGLTGKKRPRGELGLILGCDEEVAKAAAEDHAEAARERANRLAKIQFDKMGRVFPDVATGAAVEKSLRETATRGVVALFNAVSKAQKLSAADNLGKEDRAEGKEPVSRETFMNMIRAGVSKTSNTKEEDGESEDGRGAGWMHDDYMTKGSRKLKNWDKPEVRGSDNDDDDDDDDDDDSMPENEHESSSTSQLDHSNSDSNSIDST